MPMGEVSCSPDLADEEEQEGAEVAEAFESSFRRRSNSSFEAKTEEANRGREALVKRWWDESRPRRGGAVPRQPRGCSKDFPLLIEEWLRVRGLGNKVQRQPNQGGFVVYRLLNPAVEAQPHWEEAFHGTRWYALWLILESGLLLESNDKEMGHDFWEPGVYCSPVLETARWYARPHILFGDGTYHRALLQLRVDPASRKRERQRGGVQWVFPASAVSVRALWLEINAPPDVDEDRFRSWDADLEALPANKMCPEAIVNPRIGPWSEDEEDDEEEEALQAYQAPDWLQTFAQAATMPRFFDGFGFGGFGHLGHLFCAGQQWYDESAEAVEEVTEKAVAGSPWWTRLPGEARPMAPIPTGKKRKPRKGQQQRQLQEQLGRPRPSQKKRKVATDAAAPELVGADDAIDALGERVEHYNLLINAAPELGRAAKCPPPSKRVGASSREGSLAVSEAAASASAAEGHPAGASRPSAGPRPLSTARLSDLPPPKPTVPLPPATLEGTSGPSAGPRPLAGWRPRLPPPSAAGLFPPQTPGGACRPSAGPRPLSTAPLALLAPPPVVVPLPPEKSEGSSGPSEGPRPLAGLRPLLPHPPAAVPLPPETAGGACRPSAGPRPLSTAPLSLLPPPPAVVPLPPETSEGAIGPSEGPRPLVGWRPLLPHPPVAIPLPSETAGGSACSTSKSAPLMPQSAVVTPPAAVVTPPTVVIPPLVVTLSPAVFMSPPPFVTPIVPAGAIAQAAATPRPCLPPANCVDQWRQATLSQQRATDGRASPPAKPLPRVVEPPGAKSATDFVMPLVGAVVAPPAEADALSASSVINELLEALEAKKRRLLEAQAGMAG